MLCSIGLEKLAKFPSFYQKLTLCSKREQLGVTRGICHSVLLNSGQYKHMQGMYMFSCLSFVSCSIAFSPILPWVFIAA